MCHPNGPACGGEWVKGKAPIHESSCDKGGNHQTDKQKGFKYFCIVCECYARIDTATVHKGALLKGSENRARHSSHLYCLNSGSGSRRNDSAATSADERISIVHNSAECRRRERREIFQSSPTFAAGKKGFSGPAVRLAYGIDNQRRKYS